MVRAFPVLVALIVGILTAVGGYTFIYARGYSYMTNDPQACANCHVIGGPLPGVDQELAPFRRHL